MDMERQLYQISEIRLLEQLAINGGISEKMLMERASLAAFHVLQEVWPKAKKIVVFCGTGNNGGDGYTFAAFAKEQGYQVSIRYVGNLEKLKDESKNAFHDCQKLKIETKPFDEHEDMMADVIIDALLGIGIKENVSALFTKAIKAVNQFNIPVLALDIPSGIHADTGAVLGDAIKAAVTVSFIGLKRGLFTGRAPAYCGKIFWDRLSIPPHFLDRVKVSSFLLIDENIIGFLPARPKDVHKGNFGHVLVVGGYKGMGGAVRMAAESAYRMGAGLVTVATLPEHVVTVNAVRPEIMAYGLEEVSELASLLEKASVVVVGPGLGQAEWSHIMLDRVLASQKPLVIDADALNLLSTKSEHRENWILTPHPGEMSKLLGLSTDQIQEDRFNAVEQCQAKYGGVSVLKGVGTLIKGHETPYYVCSAGNPGMATGGMGDVLSGIIAGLVGQGLNLFTAARLGVYIHALAGDHAAQLKGERGLLAMDVIEELRPLVNRPPHLE